MAEDAKHREHGDPREQLWELLDEFTFTMLTTHDTIGGRDGMRARPMAQHLDREAGVIRFLSNRTAGKVEEIADEHDVALIYADAGDSRYVSVSGRATQTTDRALIKRLWDAGAEIWFEGDAETADVVVIEVRPLEAEYWRQDDNALARGFKLVKGFLSDEQPDVGANAKIDFSNPSEAA